MKKLNLNEFVKHFADQFEDTNPDDINANCLFREIKEWDSLNALSIIAMVDEVYNVKLTGDDIRKSKTVNDLFEIVESRIV